MNLLTKRPRTVIGVLGSLVLAGGAAGCGSSADPAQPAAAAGTPAAASDTAASSGATGAPTGPPAGRPPMGTPVSGTAAKRAAAAALAKYPGTVEGVERRNGTYVVHVITSSGELHVLVDSAFTVTGVEQRPSGPPGGGPPSGQPAAPSQPSSGSGSAASSGLAAATTQMS